ncbi:bifunctional phosphoglucose/phosphomannose isomerase [Sanyastnella coralliicola]|uniref:bifunctional phosphoglucose/phosphomannose isomerase n=1 Tax=Sanyastnella coralliicola TaxID=3069118 RepID=UPI0027BA59B7|nr:bifunctional phosphoglucose/phosphomannose isomerase [Longitalea sp. SCSIO 12813]
MRQLIADFPQQLDLAWKNADLTTFQTEGKEISNLVISGLGGSGIGGKIISQLIQDSAKVPVIINNDYTLPAFVDTKTLVVISSYSGNTEETVSAMNLALDKGAQVSCITSGGQVHDMAKQHGLNAIVVPGGQPPRSQFGYSAISLIRTLVAYEIIDASVFASAERLGGFLRDSQEQIINRASKLADFIQGHIPIIYSETKNEGVAIRWRQQINENSKLLCWHHVYPEMNHNELVGWESGDDRFCVLMLRSADDHPRSVHRMNITAEIIRSKGAKVEDIQAEGSTRLEQIFDLIHLGDWLSLIVAENNDVDPVIITNIDFLKNELSKIN